MGLHITGSSVRCCTRRCTLPRLGTSMTYLYWKLSATYRLDPVSSLCHSSFIDHSSCERSLKLISAVSSCLLTVAHGKGVRLGSHPVHAHTHVHLGVSDPKRDSEPDR